MVDVSKLSTGENTYEIKDNEARNSIANLATIASTGEYNDLVNKPTIPNSVADLSDASDYITINDMVNTTLITIANVASTGEYSDLLNKPTIPVVGDGILTITQGGNIKGTFSANELSNTTIDLDRGVTGDYVTLDTSQTITGVKTFQGNKIISFKQTRTTDKPGFTIYTNSLKELATFEYRPDTVNSYPLLYLGQWKTDADSVVKPLYVGFRLFDNSISDPAAYNLLAPLARDARDDFNLTSTHQHFYLPLGFKNGNTMVTTSTNGVANLSTLIPSVDQTYNASSTNAQSGVAIANVLGDIETLLHDLNSGS